MEKNYKYWKDHLNTSIKELDRITTVINNEKSKDYVETSKRYIRNVFCDCIEMLYKSMKYVFNDDGIELKQDSPKAIFREGLRQNLYTQGQCNILINAVDLRNTIVHDYDMYERTEQDLIEIKSFKQTLDDISDSIIIELEVREKEY